MGHGQGAHAVMQATPLGGPPSHAHTASHQVANTNGLTAAQWGMASFLFSEVAFFCTLIVAYVAYMGADIVGPTPAQALSLPLVLCTTACLLLSSFTIHLAELALHRAPQKTFCLWWGLTSALGIVFLAGTAYEWRELIEVHHLTISRNLFGTTYYTLVGFHGLHVTGGVICLLIVLALGCRSLVNRDYHVGVQLVAWYWHFVDVVWVVVFALVYLVGR